EFARRCDRAIDVRLGSEMNDRARPFLLKYFGYKGLIVYVAVNKSKSRISFQVYEILEHPGIGKRIEDDHPRRFGLHPAADEVRPDESGSAGNDDRVLHQYPSRGFGTPA